MEGVSLGETGDLQEALDAVPLSIGESTSLCMYVIASIYL